MNDLFARFSAAIRAYGGDAKAESLLLTRDGDISVFYAPFEYINTAAKVVLVGITPGPSQADNALKAAQASLRAGGTAQQAQVAAKLTGGFSGDLRDNLVAMLQTAGVHRLVGAPDAGALFDSHRNLVHTASVVPFPAFRAGRPFNGAPMSVPVLKDLALEHFGLVAKALPGAHYVAMGDKVLSALQNLSKAGVIKERQILGALQHPSTANNERVAFFCGVKQISQLSNKTNPHIINAMRTRLQTAVEASLAGAAAAC